MKLVARTTQFHVYDEVLNETDLRTVWNYVQLESYVPVHHEEWAKTWRVSDGVPLGAPSGRMHGAPAPAGAAAPSEGPSASGRHGSLRSYPTHTGIDRVLETI